MDSNEMRKIFVGQNSNYYTAQWDLHEKTGIRMLPNKAAFSVFWFFYRKMYLIGTGILIGLIIMSFVIQIILTYAGLPETISIQAGRLVVLGFWVFIGLKANPIYLHHVERKIAKVKEGNPNDLENALKKSGGVSAVAVLIPIAIIAGFMYLLIMFLSQLVKMI